MPKKTDNVKRQLGTVRHVVAVDRTDGLFVEGADLVGITLPDVEQQPVGAHVGEVQMLPGPCSLRATFSATSAS